MRVVLASVLAILSLTCEALASPTSPGRVEFDVLRNGQPFGRHTVTVTETAGGFVARSNVALRVAAGPVTVFRYEHACVETWRASALTALDCDTLKGGRRLSVNATQTSGGLLVSGEDGESVMPATARPTSWWLRPPTDTGFMLDTETGARMPLRVTHMGREPVRVGEQTIDAERFRVRGDVTVDLWYDQQGRWVGCAFTTRGQNIEYRLTSPRSAGPA